MVEKGEFKYQTHTGHKLTAKEDIFINVYIETDNATEAARKAGYGKKKQLALENKLKNSIEDNKKELSITKVEKDISTANIDLEKGISHTRKELDKNVPHTKLELEKNVSVTKAELEKELSRYLAVKGNNVRQKSYIAQEIFYRKQQLIEKNKDSICSAEELLTYLSKVVRGEEKDQFGLDIPISERTRAAVELAKRVIDLPNKTPTEAPKISITLDWTNDNSDAIDADFTPKESEDEDVTIGQTNAQIGD